MSITDVTVLQQRLEEARTALHALNTGRQRVTLSKDGTSVTYASANARDLRNYIKDLEGQLARVQGKSARRSFYTEFR